MKPLPFDVDFEGEAQKSFVCEAVLSALAILLKENAFHITTTRCVEISRAAAEGSYAYEPDAASSLGTIAVVVRDVLAHSSRPLWEVIDILFTVITGFPCIVDRDLMISDRHFGTYSDYAKRVSWWVKVFVGFQVRRIINITAFRNAKPVRRWKQSMYCIPPL